MSSTPLVHTHLTSEPFDVMWRGDTAPAPAHAVRSRARLGASALGPRPPRAGLSSIRVSRLIFALWHEPCVGSSPSHETHRSPDSRTDESHTRHRPLRE
eukprot:4100543-Prymnesium_polylepis.1